MNGRKREKRKQNDRDKKNREIMHLICLKKKEEKINVFLLNLSNSKKNLFLTKFLVFLSAFSLHPITVIYNL